MADCSHCKYAIMDYAEDYGWFADDCEKELYVLEGDCPGFEEREDRDG